MGKKSDDDQSSGGSSDNCSQCWGRGRITATQEDDEAEIADDFTVPCGLCGGTGKRS